MVAVAALALACSKKDSDGQGSGTVVKASVLADLVMTLPQGWTSAYDGNTDAWSVTGPGVAAHIERADERYVASPDAYMQHLAPRWGKKLVTIEQREQAGSSGFAITLAVFAAQNDPHPLRSTHMVRKLQRVYVDCNADGIDDEALREQLLTLCRSVRL
jgi:hypothetical protein